MVTDGFQKNLDKDTGAIGKFLHCPPSNGSSYFTTTTLFLGAQVQVPQHVARSETRDQQLFGVVASFIATKGRIARTVDGSFPRNVDREIARE